MRDAKEYEERVRTACQKHGARIESVSTNWSGGGTWAVIFAEGVTATFQLLGVVASALETDKINIEHESGEHRWSSVTTETWSQVRLVCWDLGSQTAASENDE